MKIRVRIRAAGAVEKRNETLVVRDGTRGSKIKITLKSGSKTTRSR